MAPRAPHYAGITQGASGPDVAALVIADALARYLAALPPGAPTDQVVACAEAFQAGVIAGVDAALWTATQVIDGEDAPPPEEYCDVSGIRLDPPRRPR
jgi:hypothetical protein